MQRLEPIQVIWWGHDKPTLASGSFWPGFKQECACPPNLPCTNMYMCFNCPWVRRGPRKRRIDDYNDRLRRTPSSRSLDWQELVQRLRLSHIRDGRYENHGYDLPPDTVFSLSLLETNRSDHTARWSCSAGHSIQCLYNFYYDTDTRLFRCRRWPQTRTHHFPHICTNRFQNFYFFRLVGVVRDFRDILGNWSYHF